MPSSLTPAERSLRASIAANTRWAKEDPIEGTAKARAKFLQGFIDQVDPDRALPELERLRRAENAKTAYFKQLALKSSRSRKGAA